MAELGPHTDGFDRKMEILKGAFSPDGFFSNFPQDALTFLRGKILEETLNRPASDPGPGPTERAKGTKYIRRISGQLARAYGTPPLRQMGPYTWALFPSISAAPYAPAVNDRLRARVGDDVSTLTATFYAPEVNEAMIREFSRFMTHIKRRQSYSYQNPFPA